MTSMPQNQSSRYEKLLSELEMRSLIDKPPTVHQMKRGAREIARHLPAEALFAMIPVVSLAAIVALRELHNLHLRNLRQNGNPKVVRLLARRLKEARSQQIRLELSSEDPTLQ